MKLIFCGAAKAVTGSCHLLETAAGKILIDCGMRQGEDAKGEFGEGTFPFDPSEIRLVLATHAHIDHIGLIPLLVKRGFTGEVLSTDATAQLATIMLPDSAHIQEQDAQYQNKKNQRAGKPLVDPLYTQQDAAEALKRFHGVPYGKLVELLPGVTCRFNDAGHLLGSASIEIMVEEAGKTTKVVFSGDLGRAERPILKDPDIISSADYLVLEGTYGDEDHAVTEQEDKEQEFANVIRGAIARRGNLVIPAFAVGRTQELLYFIKRLLAKNAVPGLERMPVYIDSPMAIQATKVYERCARGYYDEETQKMAKDGSPFDFPTLHIAETADESKQINTDPIPKIIISASGMCDAGRVRHHLKHNLYQATSTVMFAGYQAVGTLGRTLQDGAQKVKLFGESIRVNANIVSTRGFSGHAGRNELVDWAMALEEKPKRIFLVHGEEKALYALRDALRERGAEVTVPNLLDEVELSPRQAQAEAKQTAPKERTATSEKAKEAPAPKAAPAKEEEAISLESTSATYEAVEQLKRIYSILQRSQQRRSPDMELKRTILEADLLALADKWDQLIL